MLENLPADLREAIESFELIQHNCDGVGAEDSDTEAIFHHVIRMALVGGVVDWEALDWDLYRLDNLAGLGFLIAAKKNLTKYARKVYDAISKHSGEEQTKTVLEAYAWRHSRWT